MGKGIKNPYFQNGYRIKLEEWVVVKGVVGLDRGHTLALTKIKVEFRYQETTVEVSKRQNNTLV